MKKTFLALLVLLVTISSATSAMAAEPAYQHALVNLRTAHYLIDTHPKDWKTAPKETHAKNDITAAMLEIKKAGIDDGKDLKEHPLDVERITDRKERLTKALNLLKTTYAEIAVVVEKTPDDKHLKFTAQAHIKEAGEDIEKMIAGEK